MCDPTTYKICIFFLYVYTLLDRAAEAFAACSIVSPCHVSFSFFLPILVNSQFQSILYIRSCWFFCLILYFSLYFCSFLIVGYIHITYKPSAQFTFFMMSNSFNSIFFLFLSLFLLHNFTLYLYTLYTFSICLFWLNLKCLLFWYNFVVSSHSFCNER